MKEACICDSKTSSCTLMHMVSILVQAKIPISKAAAYQRKPQAIVTDTLLHSLTHCIGLKLTDNRPMRTCCKQAGFMAGFQQLACLTY